MTACNKTVKMSEGINDPHLWRVWVRDELMRLTGII